MTAAARFSLPVPIDGRMTAARKASIVDAVTRGDFSLEDAQQIYGISAEEFLSWLNPLIAHGMDALKVGRLQHYRHGGAANDCA